MPYANLEKQRKYWRKRDAGRREYLRQYREKNGEAIKRQKREHYLANKDRILAKDREYQKANRHRFRERDSKKSIAWQLKQKSKGCCTWCGKPSGGFVRCEEHRKWFRKYVRLRRLRNIEFEREKDRIKVRIRLTDPNQKLAFRIRGLLRDALRRKKSTKLHSALVLLGCSIPDFRIYIESKFDVGMTWQNWGNKQDQWNLDHIIPIALFDLSRASHQERCFHFSNYQPLWRTENQSKGSKVFGSHQFDLL